MEDPASRNGAGNDKSTDMVLLFFGIFARSFLMTRMFLGDKDPAGHRVSEAEYVARCTVVIPLSREQQQPSLSAMESNPNSIKLADKDNTPPPAPTT